MRCTWIRVQLHYCKGKLTVVTWVPLSSSCQVIHLVFSSTVVLHNWTWGICTHVSHDSCLFSRFQSFQVYRHLYYHYIYIYYLQTLWSKSTEPIQHLFLGIGTCDDSWSCLHLGQPFLHTVVRGFEQVSVCRSARGLKTSLVQPMATHGEMIFFQLFLIHALKYTYAKSCMTSRLLMLVEWEENSSSCVCWRIWWPYRNSICSHFLPTSSESRRICRVRALCETQSRG